MAWIQILFRKMMVKRLFDIMVKMGQLLSTEDSNIIKHQMNHNQFGSRLKYIVHQEPVCRVKKASRVYIATEVYRA